MTDITEDDINGRIMALITQRNRALDESVVLMGRIAVLEKTNAALESSNSELRKAVAAIKPCSCPVPIEGPVER